MTPLERTRSSSAEPDDVLTTRLTDDEVWNLFSSLSVVIADGLRRLHNGAHCYPEEMTYDEWRAILDEMARDFQKAALHDRRAREPYKPTRGLELLEKWWFALWD